MIEGRRVGARVGASVLSLLACVALAGCAKGVRRTLGESGATGTEGRGAGAARKAEPVVYVALGDSTGVGVGARQGGGYVARLFERLERERAGSRVVNLCVSGAETSDVLRSQVPRVALSRPTLVTLGVGINDLTHGVEVEQFARNYEELVVRIKAATDAPVVATNMPDISTAPRVPAFMREGVAHRIALFNDEIKKIAARHRLRLVDAYGMSREVIAAHPEFFSADGFHPSDEGYEYWAKMMWGAVKEAVGED